MKLDKIWFDKDYIYGKDTKGNEYKQSLLWYPKLKEADDEERDKYKFAHDGIHWDKLDEAVSFESFTYDDADPSEMQKFFLTHKELNISVFAKRMGINPTLLRNYINGFKRPSVEREEQILNAIYELGKEYTSVNFKCKRQRRK